MIMRLSKRMTMVVALHLSVIGADVCAQEVADSVWVDSVEVDSVALAEEYKSDKVNEPIEWVNKKINTSYETKDILA